MDAGDCCRLLIVGGERRPRLLVLVTFERTRDCRTNAKRVGVACSSLTTGQMSRPIPDGEDWLQPRLRHGPVQFSGDGSATTTSAGSRIKRAIIEEFPPTLRVRELPEAKPMSRRFLLFSRQWSKPIRYGAAYPDRNGDPSRSAKAKCSDVRGPVDGKPDASPNVNRRRRFSYAHGTDSNRPDPERPSK